MYYEISGFRSGIIDLIDSVYCKIFVYVDSFLISQLLITDFFMILLLVSLIAVFEVREGEIIAVYVNWHSNDHNHCFIIR